MKKIKFLKNVELQVWEKGVIYEVTKHPYARTVYWQDGDGFETEAEDLYWYEHPEGGDSFSDARHDPDWYVHKGLAEFVE
jgi:hypothetical protein